jgi:hypothetical protein
LPIRARAAVHIWHRGWLRPALVKIGRDPGSKMIDPSSHGLAYSQIAC